MLSAQEGEMSRQPSQQIHVCLNNSVMMGDDACAFSRNYCSGFVGLDL